MPKNSQAMLPLLDILRTETDAEHRLSAPALLQRLAGRGIRTERRSIYRAVDLLQKQGQPVEKTTTGYYYARAAADEDDLFALAAAVQAAGFLSDARKLALFQALGARWGARAVENALFRCALTASSAADDTLFVAMQTAGGAIAAGRQLTFLAPLPEPGGTAHFRVNPYAVCLAGGSYWLICNVEGEPALSRFPLAPLSALREEPQPRRHFSEVSPYKTHFDAEDALLRLSGA